MSECQRCNGHVGDNLCPECKGTGQTLPYVWADVYEAEGERHPLTNPNPSVFSECVLREDYERLWNEYANATFQLAEAKRLLERSLGEHIDKEIEHFLEGPKLIGSAYGMVGPCGPDVAYVEHTVEEQLGALVKAPTS